MSKCEHCGAHDHEEKEENLKAEVVKLVIALIIFATAFFKVVPGKIATWLFVAAYILSGYEVLLKSIKNIFRGEVFDENFLMSIATLGAFAINKPGEAAAVMIFYNVGELFEDYAVGKSKKSIIQLMNIKPKIANLKNGNEIKVVEPEELKVGDIIVVKAGEKIPVDGVIVNGETTIDTSALTGESVPRKVKVDDEVLAGCINESDVIEVKVTKEFKDTAINEIIELVKNSNKAKSKTELFITKFAKAYTPIVVVLALILAFVPPIFVGFQNLGEWVKRALVFLVTSCPCAIVLSVPLGYFAGIGKAGKEGVLIKGSNYLDVLTKANTMVLDKTGTITKGNFEVSKIVLAEEIGEEELLEIAAVAESMSNHPIAKSIISKVNKKISQEEIEEYKEIAGMGIKAKYHGDEIVAGNAKLLEKEEIKYYPCNEIGAIVYIAKNKKYLGAIVISDTVKPDSKEAIEGFKKNGINKICMLTGDNKEIAENIAKQVGIEEVHYNLLPGEKVKELQKIKNEQNVVIAIGDGINDSPVLAEADIGASMGLNGQDLAIETSDIVIMDGKLSSFNKAINVSKRTKKIIMQNIYFALGIKAIVLVLGAFGISTMWEAVFADVGVTFITVLNSLRIFKK
ncbi:MAG TPA: heavy metal translocating P-type ATPase [Clostridiaceae bacterium]|nr:heavy metal translocating P-type ATPase [Clostridiaceae bacterium]